MNQLDTESLAITDGVDGVLTLAKYDPAVGVVAAMALLTPQGGAINFTIDGTASTDTAGHALSAGVTAKIIGIKAIRNLKFHGTVTGTLFVTYIYDIDPTYRLGFKQQTETIDRVENLDVIFS